MIVSVHVHVYVCCNFLVDCVALATPLTPPLISDHRVNLHTYRNCCSGRRLVEWTINQSSTYRPRPQVIQMWQALVSEGILKHGKLSFFPHQTPPQLPHPSLLFTFPPRSLLSPPSSSFQREIFYCCSILILVTNSHPFRDDDQLLYQFVDRPIVADSRPGRRWSSLLGGLGDEKLPNGRPRSSSSIASSPRSSRSSLTSILDGCFDTIAALGPEVLIYATLRKE